MKKDGSAKLKKNEYPIIFVFARMIAEGFKSSPLASTLYCIADIFHAAAGVVVIIASQLFFDGVFLVANGGEISQVFGRLAFFVFSLIFLEVTNGLSNFHIEFLSPSVMSMLHQKIHIKASHINPELYEQPELLDAVNKAKNGAEMGYMTASLALMLFTFYAPYFILMSIYFQALSPLLLFSLIFIFAPVLIGQSIRQKLFAKVENKVAPARRAMDYYRKTMFDRDFFKETRLLGAFNCFLKLYRRKVDVVNKETVKAELSSLKVDFLLRILTFAGYICILIMLVYDLLKGRISVGAFAAVFMAVGVMYNYANEVFGGFMSQISRYASSITNYQRFMDLPEKAGVQAKLNLDMGITLQNVDYTYPSAAEKALVNVSINIMSGQTVAIVGENGAGKSTLTKLILGLLTPTSGKVMVGGCDVSEIDSSVICPVFSSVFQDFQKYRMTLADNISISDINADSKFFLKDISSLCEKTGLCINDFSDGIGTMLSKEFGGIDISGGQWQRIAISRGLFRAHEIIFLDEPTSAIDPIEETHVYRQFAQISENKTAIIVTHRLGAARIADIIIVMNSGRVDDVGTHEQLIERKGIYAAMFNEQSKWYK